MQKLFPSATQRNSQNWLKAIVFGLVFFLSSSFSLYFCYNDGKLTRENYYLLSLSSVPFFFLRAYGPSEETESINKISPAKCVWICVYWAFFSNNCGKLFSSEIKDVVKKSSLRLFIAFDGFNLSCRFSEQIPMMVCVCMLIIRIN